MKTYNTRRLDKAVVYEHCVFGGGFDVVRLESATDKYDSVGVIGYELLLHNA